MKTSKKVLAISSISVFALIGLICLIVMFYKSNDYKQYTDDLNGIRFLKSDWGMNVDETMASFKGENIGFSSDGYAGIYESVDKREVNGLNAKIEMYFSKDALTVMPYLREEVGKGVAGLHKVVLYFDEDMETFQKAFEKELGEDKTPIEKDGEVIGYTSIKVKYNDITDKKIKEKMDEIIKDSQYEQNKDELYLNSFNIEKTDKTKTNNKNEQVYNTKVVYEGNGLAVLNNADRIMLRDVGNIIIGN